MLGTMILMTIILLATDVGGSIKKIVIELWCWWHFWDVFRGWYKEIVDAGDEKEYVTNILNLSPTYSIANIELNRLCNICLEAAIWLAIVDGSLIWWKLLWRLRIRVGRIPIASWRQFSFLIGWKCQRISINYILEQTLKESLNDENILLKINEKRIMVFDGLKNRLFWMGRIDQRRYRCFRLVKKI